MRILKKLLDNLGEGWNIQPKEVPYVVIERGSGIHSMVTVDEGMLIFHSDPYRSHLPNKQSIELQRMTAQGLLTAIKSMGYNAELAPEILRADAIPLAIMEVANVKVDTTLNAFTSNIWRRMYPIYRILRQAETDTDLALLQLDRNMATGRWLDYWGSFFGMQRRPGELAESFRRRFTMWVLNPKTNNVALQELLAYQLGESGGVEVYDKAPAVIGVRLDAKYTGSVETLAAVRSILTENKGGGISFIASVRVPATLTNYNLQHYRMHLRSRVRFFGGHAWYFDGLYQLDGIPSLSGWVEERQRNRHQLTIRTPHRVEQQQEGVVKIRQNYWLLDGSVQLDGNRLLSSQEKINHV
ncbi:hypothetical protein ABIE27_001992 [Paenibacillus sp. 4624]|uniref:hypothetical protein n=1 Tax=Paenibacillus sp. 4624 TaxID=3156453 RepID=UPI003D1A7BF0